MSLYQPSFMTPHNEAIDVTNENDMTFTWQLNGNNPLCAYNIQIFDMDENSATSDGLVYELVSTTNQRAIQKEINTLTGYITNQGNKSEKIEEGMTAYKTSTVKSKFIEDTTADRTKLLSKYNDMAGYLEDLINYNKSHKEGEIFPQTKITKFFQYWGDIVDGVSARIGKLIQDESGTPIEPDEGTGEYVKKTVVGWMNIDPTRTDGIEYVDTTGIIDDSAFQKVKTLYKEYKDYYNNVIAERAQKSASDTSYMDSTSLGKARKTLYLMYSAYASESYYAQDLYTAILAIWKQINFQAIEDNCSEFMKVLQNELSQEEYALAHLNGGAAKVATGLYSEPNTSSTELMEIPKDGEFAVIETEEAVPDTWEYIIYEGQKGYVKKADIRYYNITNGKYCLETPLYPKDFNGNANIISHKLPINILENGKAYKWRVTLYWSVNGKYKIDDQVNWQSLTSLESYFDARKRPEVTLGNKEQIFTIPYNYQTVKTETTYTYENKLGQEVTGKLNVGDTILFLHLAQEDRSTAVIQVTLPDNSEVITAVPAANLNGIGSYDAEQVFELQSKYATFIGGYSQEQYTSVSYFRWVLSKLQYDTEEVVEVIKDTGMIPSIDIEMYYDGFLNGEKYSIKLYVQTLDNVQAESIEYKFKVSYIDISIENMVNASNSPVEHGVIVEWSNLRLIEGEVVGGTVKYTEDLPADSHNMASIDKGTSIIFDTDKGKPLSVDWDANHIISMRIDEDRAADQTYYTASGLDDNGEVIYKTLSIENDENTDMTGITNLVYTIHTPKQDVRYIQQIISSPLYWYIIIMTKDSLTVYIKYADGLFPMKELVASYNGFTNSKQVVPIPLTYQEQPSDTVNYNYQTIIKKGGDYR